MSTEGPVFPVAFDEFALGEDLARGWAPAVEKPSGHWHETSTAWADCREDA